MSFSTGCGRCPFCDQWPSSLANSELSRQSAELAAQREQVARLEKDAGRWQKWCALIDNGFYLRGEDTAEHFAMVMWRASVTAPHLTAAIDAAIAQQQGTPLHQSKEQS